METKNRNLTFFLTGGTVLLSVLLLAMLLRPEVMVAYLFEDRQDTFMDYYNCIETVKSLKSDYRNSGNMYPPLCWVIFYIFRLVSGDVEGMVEAGGSPRSLRLFQAAIVPYTFALIFLILVIFGLHTRMCRFRQIENKWLSYLFLFSIPFMFLVERGNILILSFVGSLAFFVLKDSEKWWVRDIGYLCLAIAAAIKIYPAVFGFVLLREHKYKEACRLAFYGVMVFIIPFLLFTEEGLSEIPYFFRNIMGFNSGFMNSIVSQVAQESGPVEAAVEVVAETAMEAVEAVVETVEETASEIIVFDGNRIGFAAFMEHLLMWFGVSWGSAVSVAAKLSALLSAAAFAISFFAKKQWQNVLLLACVLVGFQSRSYTYTVVFMIIPCILFLNAEREGRLNYLYLLLFGLIFFPLPLGWTEHLKEDLYYDFHRSFNDLQMGGAIWLLTIICSIDIIIQYVKRKRQKIQVEREGQGAPAVSGE